MSTGGADILGMMIGHELAIRELYELFALMPGDHGEFWRSLAADEQKHADWLADLQENEDVVRWLSYHSELKLQAVKTSINYVRSQVERARSGSFTHLQALAVSRDLEGALLEKQFSRMKGAMPEEIRTVLTGLTVETERHLMTIVEALASEKKKGS